MRSHVMGRHQDARGLSLIELLIGMALSLLAIIAIYQVLSVWDSRRRTITAGSSAQISGSIGITEIERDLQLSGMGFGNASAQTIGCTVGGYNSTFASPGTFTFVFTPVQIVDGASGAPDVINVLYGNSAYVVSIQKVNTSTDTTKTLQYRTGFNAGDLVVVAGNTPRNCTLFEVTGNLATDTVTIQHGTASYTSFYGAGSVTPTMNSAIAGVSYPDGAEIYNLGLGAQRTQWAVTSGVLTRVNTLRSTTTTEVTEGVVNLQAQYGVDGSDGSALNGRIEEAEWTNTQPTDWTKLLAVRIAVLARSSQLEKDIVSPADASDATLLNSPVWAGGKFKMLNLDGSAGATAAPANDWHHYRYRVYETMVPMRNMIWGATS
jgi:type IV pilus assembly protein PilW